MIRTALILAVCATGCGVIHAADRDPKPPLAVPKQFSGTQSSTVAAKRWWRSFADSDLNRLVETALAQNFDLRRTFARLDQAIAMADRAGAGRWPQLSAEGSVARSRSPRFGPTGMAMTEQSTFDLGATFAYEVDIWGRIHSLKNAADYDLAAGTQDVEAAAMMLTAQVAESWFTILEQRTILRLLQDQSKSNETFLELVELRFHQGLATALDVFQQKQQLAATKALIPLVEARLQVAQNQLSVLLGESPSKRTPTPQQLPALPPLPNIGIPADLLTRRPDVRAAQLRVTAADYRIGAAIADRFPTIRLSARVGFQSTDLKDLFDDWLWNLAGGIVGPLIDGGARAAEVDRTEAALEEQIAAYGQTVLVALREVEDALIRETKQQEYLNGLTVQLDASRSTFTEAQSRYLGGLSDYLPVLTALRGLQQLEQNQVSARRQLLSYRIQLCRALGGTWTSNLPELTARVGDTHE